MSIKKKLEDYICTNPFRHLEVYDDSVYGCCSSWCDIKIGDFGALDKIHQSNEIEEFRNSVLDGSYRYCKKDVCPSILRLEYDGIADSCFVEKSKTNVADLYNIEGNMSIKFSFDKSCNLACPTCRMDFYMGNNESDNSTESKLNELIETFGKDIREIHVSGSGDPFYTNVFRDFLINFDETKFPNLKIIHLFTNGLALNEKMWNRISKVHKYIKYIGISMDAATKDTYTIVRKGGNWNRLIDNLKFISTIKTVSSFKFLYVVQDTNYKEMDKFTDLISFLYKDVSYGVYFTKISNWGTYTDEEFNQKEIYNEKHPEYQEFLIELNKIVNVHNTYIHMTDVVDRHNMGGIKRLL